MCYYDIGRRPRVTGLVLPIRIFSSHCFTLLAAAGRDMPQMPA